MSSALVSLACCLILLTNAKPLEEKENNAPEFDFTEGKLVRSANDRLKRSSMENIGSLNDPQYWKGRFYDYVHWRERPNNQENDHVADSTVDKREPQYWKGRFYREEEVDQKARAFAPGRFGRNFQGRFGRNMQGRFGREDEQGRFGREESLQGRFGREDDQGRFGREENMQGRFGREEDLQGRFGRDFQGRFGREEDLQGRFGREDDQGRFGREDIQGRFGRDKITNDEEQGRFGREDQDNDLKEFRKDLGEDEKVESDEKREVASSLEESKGKNLEP